MAGYSEGKGRVPVKNTFYGNDFDDIDFISLDHRTNTNSLDKYCKYTKLNQHS